MQKEKLKEKIIKAISGLGCDKCNEIDGDYFLTTFPDGQQLKYDPKEKCFVCPRGHKESLFKAYRYEDRESLLERIKAIIKILNEEFT